MIWRPYVHLDIGWRYVERTPFDDQQAGDKIEPDSYEGEYMRRIPSESSIEGSTNWCCLRRFNVSLDQAQQMTHKRRSNGHPSDRPPDLSPNVFLRHVLATTAISKLSRLIIIVPHINASPTTVYSAQSIGSRTQTHRSRLLCLQPPRQIG